MIVVDTNVMVYFLLGEELGTDAEQLFKQDPEWAAPVILMSELRNVLLGFVRQGGMGPDQAKSISDDAAAILADRVTAVSSIQVIDVALECGLTAYDAEFVALARTLGVRLITLDGAILRGAADVAVPLPNLRGPVEGREGPPIT